MPTYFKRVEPTEEGEEATFVEVNETELEVSEEHPSVKAAREAAAAAKADAIAQRNKYKKLRDAAKDEDEPEDEGETPEANMTPAQPIDLDALYNDFKTRLQTEQATEAERRNQRLTRVDETLKKHKLPKDLSDVLIELADDDAKLEKAAATIAKTGLRFDDTPAGGGGMGDTPFDPAAVVTKMFKDE